MKNNRLPGSVGHALGAGGTLLVASAQRQAGVRAAWAEQQRDAGRVLWSTPRVLTFTQFAEQRLTQQWADANLPDRLLPAAAEWAWLRDLQHESGGSGEARALHAAVRLLRDWRLPQSRTVLGGSPEGDLLLEALHHLEKRSRQLDRKPLAEWLDSLTSAPGELLCAGTRGLPAAAQHTLRRLDAGVATAASADAAVSVEAADDDEHELAMIADWCRAQLEQEPGRRLLIVDARLRQRRRQYERILSQTLSPSEWISPQARAFSTFFSIEGGQPLTEFPLIAHALLTLRLLTSQLRFDEMVLWLRMPFIDRDDVFAGAAVEVALRDSSRLEHDAISLAALLDREASPAARELATRLRRALELVGGQKRLTSEWAPNLLAALRAVGWHGARPLRTDEHQTVMRWQSLLDEFAALGTWLPRSDAAGAVATLSELARERSFDPATVSAPVTLTDSHDDPVVRYDGIWVAGLDAAQWPPPPRPDVFVPLRLQVAAGIPAASAAGQARRARDSLTAWRAATSSLVCSWGKLDGDAHRTPSPLLAGLPGGRGERPPSTSTPASLATRLHTAQIELLDDVMGTPVDTTVVVRGGVKPLTLQAECGFHAYGEVRLDAPRLEAPTPGIDPRDRGMLLHKALELVWSKLDPNFMTVAASDARTRLPAISDSVRAAIDFVFRGRVPPELASAVERERLRLERLIEKLFEAEASRSTFHIESLESSRQVAIAGGTFQVRIDRIDSLQGGGYAILDYKSGDAPAPRWDAEKFREPQLLAYLLAERGRDVQALANVSLTRGRARFTGKAARRRLLPGINGIPGMDPNKVPADEIDAAWHAQLDEWLHRLREVAARYLAGEARVQPASDACRHCHLTVLCRRVELEFADLQAEENGGD